MARCCLRAGWDKCFCLDGGTLIVQFASSVRLSGIQDVQGSSGLKVSRSSSQVQGMLQDLAQRALRVRCKTRQVDTQSLLPRLVSLVLCRGASLPLPHAPTNRTPTPPNTRANRLRPGYHGPARNQSPSCPRSPPAGPPSPGACSAPSTSMGPASRGGNGDPS